MKHLVMRLLSSALLLILSSWLVAQPVQAGTNLTVTCANQGPCTISPNQPLFNEANMAPGQTRSQTVTVINNDPDDTCQLNLTATGDTPESESETPIDLAAELFAGITAGDTTYAGLVSSGQATSALTHRQLFSALLPTSLGSLSPNTSRTYTWYATFNPQAGNEFQGLTQTFDFSVSFECTGGVESSPNPSSSPGTVQGASTGGGNTCTAAAPTQAPSLSITSQSPNTVSLSWNNVSDTHTHYALFFSRDDGEAYGAGNIGNVTSYTVSNLSGGRTYTFQVLAVNDCAPGPRSNPVSSGLVGGVAIVGEPTGGDGQVLGVQEPPAAALADGEAQAGQVAGAATCSMWIMYLPLLLLVGQLVLSLLGEWLLRSASSKKWLPILLIPLLLAAIFYWLRQCDCSGGFSWLGWLCQWYWLFAAGVLALTRMIGFTLLEEVGTAKPR